MEKGLSSLCEVRHETSMRLEFPLPHCLDANSAITSTTSAIGVAIPSLDKEVTVLSFIPHGIIESKYFMSGSIFKANPCMVLPLVSLTPTAAIFRGLPLLGLTHTPGY